MVRRKTLAAVPSLRSRRGPAPRAPLREIVTLGDLTSFSTYPSRALTPERLTAILQAADQGDLIGQADLFEDIEEKWGHLGSVLETRRLAVSGRAWDVTPAVSLGDDGEAHADFCREVLSNIPGFKTSLGELLDAVGKGFSATEIHWEIVDGVARPALLEHWPQRHFTFDDTGRALRIQAPGAWGGAPLTPHRWIVHRASSRASRVARRGSLRGCAWAYLFWAYAWKWRVQYAERYGVPFRLAKYPRAAHEKNQQLAEAALRDLGSAASAAVPDDFTFEILTASNSSQGADPYEVIIDACERWASKAVLGQTLTTSEGKSGSRALGEVHDAVRSDRVIADAGELCDTVTAQLLAPLVLFRFGPQAAYPRFSLGLEQAEDPGQMADRDAKLAKFLPLPTKWLYQRHGIPAPEKGEEVVGRAVGQPAQPKAAPAIPASVLMSVAPTGAPPIFVCADGADDDALAALVDAAREEGRGSWADLRDGLSALKASGDYETALATFTKILGEVDPRRLESVLSRLIVMSNVAGQVAAYADLAPGVEALKPAELRLVPFEEARAALARRVNVTAAEWKTLTDAAKADAFSLATAQTLDVATAVHASLLEAQRAGLSFADWADTLESIYDRHGVGPVAEWHAEVVWRNAASTSLMQGRYRQHTTPTALALRPIWMYDAVGDRLTRPTHAAMDGRCFAADDPVWDEWYPPNGHSCRCNVIALSLAEVKARKLSVGDPLPETVEIPGGRSVELVADPGWAVHGGKQKGYQADLSHVPAPWRAAVEGSLRRGADA